MSSRRALLISPDGHVQEATDEEGIEELHSQWSEGISQSDMELIDTARDRYLSLTQYSLVDRDSVVHYRLETPDRFEPAPISRRLGKYSADLGRDAPSASKKPIRFGQMEKEGIALPSTQYFDRDVNTLALRSNRTPPERTEQNAHRYPLPDDYEPVD